MCKLVFLTAQAEMNICAATQQMIRATDPPSAIVTLAGQNNDGTNADASWPLMPNEIGQIFPCALHHFHESKFALLRNYSIHLRAFLDINWFGRRS